MEPIHKLPRCALASLAFAVLCSVGGKAAAQAETEPNDSWAGAQVVANLAGPFSITGGRTFGDPSDDFFSFAVRGPGLLRIVSSSPDTGADSIMGLFNSAGSLLASNDDGPAMGSMSVIEYMVGGPGTYTVAFSGYNPLLLSCTGAVTQCYDTNDDFAFDTFVAGGGAGGSTGWSYTLDISGAALVPEPHAAWLLASGLALLALRRRRR